MWESEGASNRTGTLSISSSAYTRGFVGPLAEVIAFNRVLTTNERRQVEEYLARKWSVVITPQAPSI